MFIFEMYYVNLKFEKGNEIFINKIEGTQVILFRA